MTWWIYVIECESGAWYTGVSDDPERRFRAHASGKGAKFMRMDKPKRIVAAESCITKGEALKREAAIKRLSREEKRRWIALHPYARPDA